MKSNVMGHAWITKNALTGLFMMWLVCLLQDSELLRRQALERRLEQEESKQQEKNRKKKKIKF